MGPSRVPLRSIYQLIAAGHWMAPPDPRDTSNDMTDRDIWALV